LCTAMNSMPGCTIRATCAATPDLKTSIYCEDFSIYKTLCSDMPKMNGCGNYTSMCAPGSVVNQCNTPAAPVPSTMKTFGYIKSICTEPGMLMEACYRCQGKNGPGTGMNCDLLTVYSDLCVDMPGMTQCSGWEDFCKVMDNWPYCSCVRINPIALNRTLR
jgi:copper transporter 1